MYEIEKDVPVPIGGKWKPIVAKMEIGDSVVVAGDMEAKTLKACIHTYFKKEKNVQVATAARRLEDGTFRVWRLDTLLYPPRKRQLNPTKRSGGQT